MSAVSPARRTAILERDLCRCRYCGCQTNDWFGQDRPTIDHLLPRCLGGSNAIDNLVTACFACNYAKGSRTYLDAGMDLLPVGTLVVFPRHRRRPLRYLQPAVNGGASGDEDVTREREVDEPSGGS